MEMGIFNTVSPGDSVLCLVCGVFGERWAKVSGPSAPRSIASLLRLEKRCRSSNWQTS